LRAATREQVELAREGLTRASHAYAESKAYATRE
jgi:hypothetical protein